MTTRHATAIASAVRSYILLNFGTETLDTTLLKEIPGLDSIAMLEFILYLEEAFSIAIPDEDVTLDHFVTVASVEAYLRSRGVS